jgi:hypothetical protein
MTWWIYPFHTEEEYLTSFLLYGGKADRELYASKCRYAKVEILESMSNRDIQDILSAKRKYEPSCHSIVVLWNEISRRSRGPDDSRRDLNKQKDDVPILDVIERYVSVRSKRGWLMKCPFPDHEDWSPSFSINVARNKFKCFGCQAWGSQIDFIMHMEKCDLKTAIDKFLQY